MMMNRQLPVKRRRNQQSGFTLIELIVVVTIIGILAAVAVSNVKWAQQRAREAALRHDLFEMRKAIDDYYADKQKYPDSLATLKSEVAALSKTHSEQAESIAGFTEVSTREATREQKNPHLLELSLDGLTASVEEFESSHPKLVQIVNSIELIKE